MTADLETILERAIAGRQVDKARIFRPSWFYSMIEDPFWIWCEYHAPDHERVDETTRFDRHLMQLGNDWEDQYVAEKFPDAHQVESRWGVEAVRETVGAMLRGESAIHGGALWLLGEDVYGKSDVLVRCDDHPSDLGDFHYRVKEVKNSKAAKPYHQLQAAVYTWILAELQGYCPESFDIVLREGDGEQTIAFEWVVEPMRQHLTQWRKIRDGQVSLDPLAYDSTPSPWRQFANRIIQERRDLSLLPGVGLKTAVKLRERGFPSTSEILALGADGCVQEFRRDHHYYHALANREARPVFRPGQSASIQRRKRLVYFDVEDISTLDREAVTRPHAYMLGCVTPDGETQVWTARGEGDEARMWSDFLDWLGDPGDVALYCWTMYEAGKLRQAAANHPDLEDRLMAAEAALIDLKEEIKHRPYFPVPSYSIKAVAPVCGFHWSQDDVDGLSAQLLYLDWLKSGDDSIIEKVEQYNREDVLAMLAVDQYVNGMCAGEAPEPYPFRTSFGLGYRGGVSASDSFRATSAKPILRGEETVARIQDRMIRAAKLDARLYEEVEADRGAMRQAMTVVVLSAVAAGIGNVANGGLLGIIGGTIAALVGWYIWAFLTYFIGTRLLPEPDTRADHRELLRTIGFSSAPGLIRVFGIIPGLTPFVFAVAGGWMLVAMVIAVRQALDYQSTWRAFGVCVIGWVVQALVLVIAVSIFGSP